MRDVIMMTGGPIGSVFAMSERFGVRICLAPDDGGGTGGDSGGGAGEGAGAGGDKSPETILFGTEGGGDKGEEKPNDTAGDGEQKTEGEWKEYEPDPAKTDEENAKLKVEHDAKNPADPINQVPEDGKYEFKMPEGVTLDEGMAKAFQDDFKDLGLTRAQAQRLADRMVEVRRRAAEEYASSPEGAWSLAAHSYFKENGTPDTWADTAKIDKEIGGKNWNSTVDNAQRAVKQFGTDGLKAFMNASGGGNHPEVIRFFARVGNAISEDKPSGGGSDGSGKPVEAAHILFPNDKPKG